MTSINGNNFGSWNYYGVQGKKFDKTLKKQDSTPVSEDKPTAQPLGQSGADGPYSYWKENGQWYVGWDDGTGEYYKQPMKNRRQAKKFVKTMN